eukprot:TRINITY_DN12485_c0_g1_i1.p2 TRINITY_DN12485_c0_g1~~TRINITY_DN12485_c0_g1_i1.p2  ORF type:complete len:254 (+),score=72.70 TRINITY_DN12485_c0_g1_i1:52-813(+)
MARAASLLFICVTAAGLRPREGEVRSCSKSWRCERDDGAAMEHLGGDGSCTLSDGVRSLTIAGASACVTVEYDGDGPYLAVNVSFSGAGDDVGTRFKIAIEYVDAPEGMGDGDGAAHSTLPLAGLHSHPQQGTDAIIYHGDGGYSMCCRFVHGAACEWRDKREVVTSCPMADGFRGSIRKPLHHHHPGGWVVAMSFGAGDAGLGAVSLPFDVSAKDMKVLHFLKGGPPPPPPPATEEGTDVGEDGEDDDPWDT